MRRSLTWLGVGAGALAFWRWGLRRRKAAPPAPEDPAEELKRKLAESRSEEPPAAAEPERPRPEQPQVSLDEQSRSEEPPAAAEPERPRPEQPQGSLDERRRAVHDRARQAIDEMLGGENLPGEED